jgi:hypothetical protein
MSEILFSKILAEFMCDHPAKAEITSSLAINSTVSTPTSVVPPGEESTDSVDELYPEDTDIDNQRREKPNYRI